MKCSHFCIFHILINLLLLCFQGDRIALFAETRAEWLTAASAIWQQEAVLCTVYTTLNDDGIVHTMNETEVPIVFTTSDLYPRIIKLLSKCPKIESIVVMEDQIEPIEINTSVNAKTISFKSLIEDDDNSEDSPTPTANPDDIAMIMYTSGSTGIPKGVELSHRNLMNFMTGFSYQIPVDDDTRYLAFLPLAHCFELACELSLVAKGSPIYYSSPTTITASSPRIMEGTLGDAMLAKPTLMSAVPLVLDKIIKNVLNKVRQMGWLKSYLFETILANKTLVDYIPIFGYALDTIFFTKVRTELGGCLRHLISGGAPISIQTQATFGALFGCKLFVGYGSTENFAYVSVSKLEDHRLGHVGPPNFGVMVKLEDWEEGNYRSTDKPNPRGEIIITGPGISRGYFKKPKETAETFFTDSQGKHCFKSGDIGEIDEYGCIKIIDRKKDLVKLKHGEYVALGYIESIIKTLPSIDTCCAYADSNKENLILLVVPNPDMILQIYREENPDKNFNISENAKEKFDIKDMYQDEALNQKVCNVPLMPNGAFNICCPRDCVSRTANVERTVRH